MNGKRYDAVTGSYLGTSSVAAQKPASVHSLRAANGTSVDGFMRVSRGSKLPPLAPAHAIKHAPKYVPAPKIVTPSIQPASTNAARSAGMDVVSHSPQRSSTLMRSAVVKPVIKSPKFIKAHTRTDLLAKVPMQTVVPKLSYNSINQVRHRRAERMVQSPAVSRYGSGGNAASNNGVVKAVATSYKVAPAAAASRPAPDYRTGQTPVRASASRQAVAVPARSSAHVANLPSSNRRPDIFAQALADAKSHEQTYEHKPLKTKKRRRALRFISATVVVLFLIGFFAYHNTSGLSLAVASYKAGLHAKLPAQKPSGFSLGYLDYKPGNVTANFTSPQDGRQFNIVQKASTWDSQALLSNFVSGANTAYKTYQQAGRTVYLLSNDTATWVDSGIWYTVEGNSSLSSTQLLELAGSM